MSAPVDEVDGPVPMHALTCEDMFQAPRLPVDAIKAVTNTNMLSLGLAHVTRELQRTPEWEPTPPDAWKSSKGLTAAFDAVIRTLSRRTSAGKSLLDACTACIESLEATPAMKELLKDTAIKTSAAEICVALTFLVASKWLIAAGSSTPPPGLGLREGVNCALWHLKPHPQPAVRVMHMTPHVPGLSSTVLVLGAERDIEWRFTAFDPATLNNTGAVFGALSGPLSKARFEYNAATLPQFKLPIPSHRFTDGASVPSLGYLLICELEGELQVSRLGGRAKVVQTMRILKCGVKRAAPKVESGGTLYLPPNLGLAITILVSGKPQLGFWVGPEALRRAECPDDVKGERARACPFVAPPRPWPI